MRGLNEIISLMGKLDKSVLTEAILMEATRDEIYSEYYDINNGKVKRIPKDRFEYFCELGEFPQQEADSVESRDRERC